MQAVHTPGQAALEASRTPVPVRDVRGIAFRLFLTCWLVYSIHLATNTVREIYLALAIGDHLSFRVDDYAHMHPDLFEKPGYGWHIGANPGGSMLGAVPYILFRPVVDPIVRRVNQQRAAGLASGRLQVPRYDSPWPMAQHFFQESWKRGLDIKFGFAAVIMQAFCMAPISAAGVAAMFLLLARLLGLWQPALGLALLYAFGTPVFFRTGYLNHNMILGHFAFLGFLFLWNPVNSSRWPFRFRVLVAGVAGGACLLLDYSGVVLLLGLFVYVLVKSFEEDRSSWFRNAVTYVVGTLPPVFLLWWYQFESFGNPFLPGQNWMPRVEWIDRGYQGFSLPQPDILFALLGDFRYGLFTTCPLFLLALAAPWLNRRRSRWMPSRELWFCLGFVVALYLFCSCINYTRLQFNTGIRYLAPAFPFLFIPTAVTLQRLQLPWRYFLGVAAVAQAWCMAMYRDVERGAGVLEPVLRVFTEGFQLPALTVASRMEQFREWFPHGASPLPLFALVGVIAFGIWKLRAKTETGSSTYVR